MDVEQTRAFAVEAHGSQLYGTLPYVTHLDAVAAIVQPYGETAQVIAYLHDVAEDTAVTVAQIRSTFGDLVADCVSLLTDEPGANRKERKAKTYAKLAQVTGTTSLALVVKAADRLANVRACVSDRKMDMWSMYQGEHPVFRQSAYRTGLCEPIWLKLDQLLTSWPVG